MNFTQDDVKDKILKVMTIAHVILWIRFTNKINRPRK